MKNALSKQKNSKIENADKNNTSLSALISTNSKYCVINSVDVKRLVALKKARKNGEPSCSRQNNGDIALKDVYKENAPSCSSDVDAISDDIYMDKIEVIDLGTDPNNPESGIRNAKNPISISLIEVKSSETSSDVICRICHGSESSGDLLTPCRCRGTVAVVHLKCLERWLRESSHSYCELCQHHYKIIRQPKYSIPKSICVFLRHPGTHLREILLDLAAFTLYTTCAVASTYMLMMICESLMKHNIIVSGSLSSHIIAFSAVFGMAAIDFTYSSWLMVCLQKHYEAWRDFYKNNSQLKIVLSNTKIRKNKKNISRKCRSNIR